MEHWEKVTPAPGFNLLSTTDRSQAATLVVPPNQRVGGPDNVHKAADQWLCVLAGEGRAAVADVAVELGPGALILIEAGEPLEISNLSGAPLETVNIYTPAAY